MALFKRLTRQRPKIGNLFAGGCGIAFCDQTINTTDPDQHPDRSICVVDTDMLQLEKCYGDETNPHLVKWDASGRFLAFALGEEVTLGEGAGTNREIGLAAANTSKSVEVMKKHLVKNNVNILFAGAGGGTGGPALQVAARICKEIDEDTPSERKRINIAILVMPHGGEGQSGQSVRASEARDEIVSLIPTITILNSEIGRYKADLPENFNILQANKLVDERIAMPTLQTTYELTQMVGEVHLDPADTRTALSHGNNVYYGTAKISREEAGSITAQQVSDRLFEGHFQNLDIAKSADAIIIWYIGWNPVTKCEELEKLIRKFVNQYNPSRDENAIEIYSGIRTQIPENEKPRVVIWAIAREVKTAKGLKQNNVRPITRGSTTRRVTARIEESLDGLDFNPDDLPSSAPVQPLLTTVPPGPRMGMVATLRSKVTGKTPIIYTPEGGEEGKDDITVEVPHQLAESYNDLLRRGPRLNTEEWERVCDAIVAANHPRPKMPLEIDWSVQTGSTSNSTH